MRPTKKLALLIVLTALCLGVQLTPRPPNVEFTSLIVFVVGATFGGSLGVALGVLVMFINGFFSFWGFAGLMLPFQLTGMVAMGIGGGLYRQMKGGLYGANSCIEAAVLGSFLTLLYDLITNLGVAVSFMLSGTSFFLSYISTIISGALFLVIHVISNTIIFGIFFFPLTKLMGEGKKWKKNLLLT